MPVEVAALVRRRTLGTVEVPAALAAAVENAAQSGTRSSKLQRKQTQQLVESLRQLSRTPGKGGASMSLIDANSGSQPKRTRRVCWRVSLVMCVCCSVHDAGVNAQAVSPKQALRDLKHGAALSLTPDKTDNAVPSDMDELLSVDDDSSTGIDSIESHFGAQKMPGVLTHRCAVNIHP